MFVAAARSKVCCLVMGVADEMKWPFYFYFYPWWLMPARPDLAGGGASPADRASPDWCCTQLDAKVGLNCATAMPMPGKRPQLDLAATTEPFLHLQLQVPLQKHAPQIPPHRTRQLFHHEIRNPRAYYWRDGCPITPPARPPPASAPRSRPNPRERDVICRDPSIPRRQPLDTPSLVDPALRIDGRSSQLSM